MKGSIKRLLEGIRADDESESEREGYLSWRGEFHAAAWGFSVAFLAALTGNIWILLIGVGWVFARRASAPEWLPYPRQFAKESLYLIAHTVPGYALGIALGQVVL